MSLPPSKPSHAISGLQPVALLVVYGPAAASVTRRIAATDRRGDIGVLSFAEHDSGTAAPVLQAGSVARYELPLAVGAEIEPAEIRRRIAEIARERRVTHLLIECDPTIDAMAVAEVVSNRDTDDEYSELARFHSSIVAVDASTLVDLFVRQRPATSPWSAAAVAEQVERADTVLLEDGEQAPDSAIAEAIVTALNPLATFVRANEEMSLEGLLERADATNRPARAAEHSWRASIAAERAQTFGEGITSAAYRSRRPFHPQRFAEFLKHDLEGIIRAKGFFWLATQMDVVGGLNVAGPERQAASVGQWWAAIASQLAEGATAPEEIRTEWVEPFGDRRQALSFVGVGLDAARLRERLDRCVLTDSEMAAGESSWQSLADPFPKWSHAHAEHQCDHDCHHDHHHDHHCHDDAHCSCHGH